MKLFNPALPNSGRVQSLQYVSVAYECGWGTTPNQLENPKITFFHNLAVGTVSLFPPYKSIFF